MTTTFQTVHAECGCEIRVELTREPLSRDEVERDCLPNDPEVTAAEIVKPCMDHGWFA